ncbi:hypothetical protein ACRHK7_01120 [Weissella tructae]|uniref:hypothetical protein n=1 Tax=Weissella tructae TaxID=887702 RepID=UPI003D8B8604
MDLTELRKNLVEGTKLPVAYRSFEATRAPDTPFIVYYVVERNDEQADDSVYVKNSSVNVELYFAQKDLKLEEKLESVLQGMGIVFKVFESSIEEEKMLLRTYEFDLMEE